MNATFSIEGGAEVITLSGGSLGKDEVVRPATDADRREFASEYDAFKNPPAPEPSPEELLAEIEALKAQLAAKAKVP